MIPIFLSVKLDSYRFESTVITIINYCNYRIDVLLMGWFMFRYASIEPVALAPFVLLSFVTLGQVALPVVSHKSCLHQMS